METLLHMTKQPPKNEKTTRQKRKEKQNKTNEEKNKKTNIFLRFGFETVACLQHILLKLMHMSEKPICIYQSQRP